jgi:hypothetical protein
VWAVEGEVMLSKLKNALRSVVQFRVRRWGVSMRGWDEQTARVLICCETRVWYWVLAEFVFWDLQTYVCHYTDFIKLPGFIRNWERHWDKDDPEYFAKFEDYFGGSIHSLWHGYICDPLVQWVWRHNEVEAEFELTLDEARKKFAHDPTVYQWVERELKRHEEWDAEDAAEKAAKASE